tara:strand:+ start:218 stop:754 length:537 start_codon:yes stop_codon:yes gene_type:complete
MKIIKTNFDGLLVVKQDIFSDKRGSLRIIYNKKIIKHNKFIFDYCTTSYQNVLRGMHFQHRKPQGKYVNVVKGKILDCVVDLRKNSKTFGKVFKIILSDKNRLSLYVPEGFAHSYFSYEKLNIIYYQLTDYYNPKYEDGINPLDESLKILWPSTNLIMSKKDKQLGTIKDFQKKYKYL